MLGVPVQSRALQGLDSLLSIVQMPAGVPVATFAIGQAGAINAALCSPPRSSRSAILRSPRRSTAGGRPRPTPSPNIPLTARVTHAAARMLPPGSTIGILGGGQLGRMTAMAAARLGYRAHIFCRGGGRARRPRSPPATTVASFDDAAALARFAEEIDVATFEFENIPADGGAPGRGARSRCCRARRSSKSPGPAAGKEFPASASASRRPIIGEIADAG